MRSLALSHMNVINLIAAPADLSSKDLPLRGDVRLLGRILGETLLVVRAFSYFSQLSNITEDMRHNRRHRTHLKAGSAPGTTTCW